MKLGMMVRCSDKSVPQMGEIVLIEDSGAFHVKWDNQPGSIRYPNRLWNTLFVPVNCSAVEWRNPALSKQTN